MVCIKSLTIIFISILVNSDYVATQDSVTEPFLEKSLRWSGFQFSSAINGMSCVTPCKQFAQKYYTCQTADGWSRLCSPLHGYDYLSNECTGPCQRSTDLEYYWCPINLVDYSENWNYCGPAEPSSSFNLPIRQHKTRLGSYCVSECTKHKKFYMCKTAEGYKDHCSPFPGLDSEGNKCSSDCEIRSGETDFKCKLETEDNLEEHWGYCGVISVSSEIPYTNYGSKCVTPCTFENGTIKNKCYDGTGQQRLCSRLDGTNYLNAKCSEGCDYLMNSTRDDTVCSSHQGNISCGFVHRAGEHENAFNLFPVSSIPETELLTGSTENVIKLIDEESKQHVIFLEKISAHKVLEMEHSMQVAIVNTLGQWAVNGYSVVEQPSENWEILAQGQDQGYKISLEHKCYKHKQCKYTHFKLYLLSNGENLPEEKEVVAEVRVSYKVVKEMPDEVVTALLRSAYNRHAIFFGGFKYTIVDNRKVWLGDS